MCVCVCCAWVTVILDDCVTHFKCTAFAVGPSLATGIVFSIFMIFRAADIGLNSG